MTPIVTARGGQLWAVSYQCPQLSRELSHLFGPETPILDGSHRLLCSKSS
jgi:hypothetical protein